MTATLIFCRDPAAAIQVAGLFADREAQHVIGKALDCPDALDEVVCVAEPPASDMLAREGLAVKSWNAFFGDNDAATVLGRNGVAQVVTGTSDVDETRDVALWQAAARIGAMSLCLLDRADEATARFTDDRGSMCFPDVIAVADDTMRNAAIDDGLPANKLLVAGNLRQAHTVHAARVLGKTDRDLVRREWSATDETFCVLFASECGREAASLGRPQRFDEITALETLLDWSKTEHFRDDVADGRETRLIVRPHPRDRADKYEAWIGKSVVGDDVGRPAIGSLLAADLVAGLETSLLEEAVWVGTPSLCLLTPAVGSPSP
ncbi:MAG: hypothetical protein AAF563_13915 [Pseudomonadota bacterium]